MTQQLTILTRFVSGIRNDFAEIGGKFRSGISRFSNNINVSEFTKLASDFLQLGSDDEEGKREGFDLGSKGAVGVTEEVGAFAHYISMHPHSWLDFHLLENLDDNVGFDMSNAQQEHGLAVEGLVPRLTALRIELCPGYMRESHFWKIYFVLLKYILPIENEDEVSFSDLEDDDGDVPASSKTSSYSLKKGSPEWVQLSQSS